MEMLPTLHKMTPANSSSQKILLRLLFLASSRSIMLVQPEHGVGIVDSNDSCDLKLETLQTTMAERYDLVHFQWAS
jgi:hypothetical protein